MDPLWVLVILVGGALLVIAAAFVVVAAKVAGMAREVGPKVAEIQEQLSAASAEIVKASQSIQAAEAQVSSLADKASVASRTVTKVVDVVPGLLHKVEDLDIRAQATVRAVGIIAARTIYNARERAHASEEVTLK